MILKILLWCPQCGKRHVDEGEFATKEHHTHACQYCGMCWRPAIEPTCGVQFLPGFKNEEIIDHYPTVFYDKAHRLMTKVIEELADEMRKGQSE